MLQPRIIPYLLLGDGGLVKTEQFSNRRYLGDPLNAVRIFNEKEVDELTVLDIDASRLKRKPDFLKIRKMADECRMPFCYGGGITTVDQVSQLYGSGVEKVSLSAAALAKPQLVSYIAGRYGSQSVVVTLDVKKSFLGKYEVWTHNATQNTKKSPEHWLRLLIEAGAGEIVVQSIDKDGMMGGYDFKLNDKIFNNCTIPLTFLGGAGSLADMKEVSDRYGSVGIGAGSLFVYKGKMKAVLINYPSCEEKENLFKVS